MSDIDALRRVAEYCNRCRCTRATPTSATSSSRPSPDRIRTRSRRAWPRCRTITSCGRCPTSPIDPHHVGRSYEAVIRVNSQSGKGGVAYIMEIEHGMVPPASPADRVLPAIQHVTEDTGTEISPGAMWKVFSTEYLEQPDRIELLSHEVARSGDGEKITAQLLVNGSLTTITGAGLRSDRGVRRRPSRRARRGDRRRRLLRARDHGGRGARTRSPTWKPRAPTA